MEMHVAVPPKVNPTARDEFYRLLAKIPQSEAAWAERQTTLAGWRSDLRFEPYWPTIEQMLTVDFPSFQRRAEVKPGLDGYDFDAWREHRDYDLKHAHNHLP